MNEAAKLFGPDGNLLGILASPPDAAPASLACLLLNVGVTHRVGPRRLNVKWARHLALRGVPSLRFDLSGIGDSPAASSRVNFREQAILDMRSALDFVEKTTGIRRFVVLGVCSGAANGYWLAVKDARVVGLLMFDGFTFPTWKTQLVHDWQRLHTTPWKTVLRKGFGRVGRLLGAPAAAAPESSIFNTVSDLSTPSRDQFAAAMESLVARGVSVYMIYSGSLLLYHNYHGQLRDAFRNAPFLGRVRYDYMPDVDHIATSLEAQKKLTAAVCDWVAGLAATEAKAEPRKSSVPA